MKKCFLAGLLAALSPLALNAQTPSLVQVYSNGSSDAIDLYNYNVGSFAFGGSIYFLGLVDPATEDVEWIRYNPATNTYTQVTNSILNGSDGSIQYFTTVGNYLLYGASLSGYDRELSVVDLNTNSHNAITINSGSCGATPAAANPRSFVVVPGNKAYFFAASPTQDIQLYRWDATSPTTVTQVTSYNKPGNGISSNSSPLFVNNRLLFDSYIQSIANGQNFCPGHSSYYVNNHELVRMETSNNAITTHDLYTGTFVNGAYTYQNNSDPQGFFDVNGRVLFQARNGSSYQLFSYDMNAATPTPQVLTSWTNVQSSGAISNYVWDGGNKVYFSVTTYANGQYVSVNMHVLDLTTNAVTQLTAHGNMDAAPTPLLYHSGFVYFAEFVTEDNGYVIKKINTGTNAITTVTSNTATTAYGFYPLISGTKIFLSADLNDGAGEEMVSFDASGGTAFVRHGDVEAGSGASYPWLFNQVGSDLYYFATSSATGTQLYKLPNAITSLPVQWVRFSATGHNGKALLEWETANEQSTESFEVQRSADGRNFEPVGARKAQGSAATYQFTDIPPASGQYYYRIRLKERDGSESFSAVRTLQFTSAPQISVAQHGDVLIVNASEAAQYQLVDCVGRQLQAGTLAAGRNNLALENVGGGMYLLRLIQTDGSLLSVEKIFRR